MSQTIDNEQFKDMLANYLAEGDQQKAQRKPAKQRKRKQPQKLQETSQVREKPAPRAPLSLTEQVEASISKVRKGVDPRKVARRLLRG